MGQLVLTVTLNPVLDYVMKVPGPLSGKQTPTPGFEISAGGKGINVSRALKNLNVPNLAVGFLGGRTGDRIKAILKKEHIHHDFIKIPRETRKSTTIIAGGKMTRFMGQGPAVGLANQKLFLEKFAARLAQCRTVVISGRPAPGLPDSFYGKLIALAHARGVKTILDSSGKSFRSALQSRPFLIKPNQEEAEAFLNKKLGSLSRLKNAAQSFLRSGVSAVIISLGQEGAIGADKKGGWFAKAPRIKVENTVGCGDAMLAGFVYHQPGASEEMVEGLRTAVAAGTANCLSLRPGDIDPGQVLALRGKVRLQRLS